MHSETGVLCVLGWVVTLLLRHMATAVQTFNLVWLSTLIITGHLYCLSKYGWIRSVKVYLPRFICLSRKKVILWHISWSFNLGFDTFHKTVFLKISPQCIHLKDKMLFTLRGTWLVTSLRCTCTFFTFFKPLCGKRQLVRVGVDSWTYMPTVRYMCTVMSRLSSHAKTAETLHINHECACGAFIDSVGNHAWETLLMVVCRFSGIQQKTFEMIVAECLHAAM